MGNKKSIEISQRITLHVSLPTAKVKLLEERHVSARTPHKIPKGIFDFEGLVLFCSRPEYQNGSLSVMEV